MSRGRATLGPIIGLVTDSTARVVYEFGFDGDVTVRVRGEDGDEVECTRESTPERPTAFAFEGLQPGKRYEVSVDEDIEVPHGGRFRTITGDLSATPFTAAVVSCNKAHVIRGLSAEEVDLWDDLAQRCEAGDIDVIFHIGDQIYADEIDQGIEGGDPKSVFSRMLQALYDMGARWVKNEGEIKERMVEEGRGDSVWVLDGRVLPPDEWDTQRERVLDEYRNCYRDTWSHGPCRRALANACNMMICDDHDISDDWGDRPYHRVGRDPMTPEVFIGTLGLQVYHEYQRSLRHDITVGEPIAEFDNEGYTHRWGDVGLMMIDMRGPRSFRCPPEQLDGDPPLICEEQWQMMCDKLDEWQDVKFIAFCTPVPPVLFSHQMTALGAKFVNDTAGQFAFEQTQLLVRLLNKLHEWKSGGEGRELIIYTGDIHIGQHTTIFADGEPALRQLIASSVGNHGAGKAGMLVMEIMGEVQHGIDDKWTFDHYGRIEADRNYGVARARCWDGTSATVVNTHVASMKDQCLQPGELASFAKDLPLSEPGVMTCFGTGNGCRRYAHIGGAGMAISEAAIFSPGDQERGASSWNPFSDDHRALRGCTVLNENSGDQGLMLGVRTGFKVGLAEEDGMIKWDVRRAEGQVGNYVCPSEEVGGDGFPFPPGVKQAEFWAERIDPETDDGDDTCFIRWREPDGFPSTVCSNQKYSDSAWKILWAFRYPQ
eukprot:TRINITY_DN8045_c2_g1_i1.p1 TRINITY_DN8045_c2_g1~~TRINITY_DN8045_c2_g1_i1.p1  ORF type:complete len:711 (+),score=271.93 TRINITY_DN8045_c2_g1_i1:94-2226(+)